MAARLIYYKSKALLPDSDILDEDDEQRLPPELVQQLLEYRKYQFAAEELREISDVAGGMLTRSQTAPSSGDNLMKNEDGQTKSGEYLDLKLGDIVLLYARLLQRIQKEKEREESLMFHRERYSVKDGVSYLRQRLETMEEFSFYEIFENINQTPKGKLVVTFIALLELTRQEFLILRQKYNFEDIRIFRKKSVLTPES